MFSFYAALGEPQLGGYVCTHKTSNATEHADTSNATEHADAPPIAMHSQTSSQHTDASSSEWESIATEQIVATDDTYINQGSASSEDEQIVATEHVHVEELDILLTMDDAS